MWIEMISEHHRKSWRICPCFPLNFPSTPPLPRSFAFSEEGKVFLGSHSLMKIYMNSKYSWKGGLKRQISAKGIFWNEGTGGRRNFPDFQKYLIKRVNLVLSAIWLNCCQWIPSKMWPLDSNFCMAHSEYKQARELVPFNSCLLPWTCTNFGCTISCWSIEVNFQPAGVSCFSWCFS